MSEPAATAPEAALIPSRTVVAPGERFPYEVRNTGSVRIGFGEPYRLEQPRGGEWQPCRLRIAFRLPLYLLAPGESRTLTAYVPAEVEPGHHRLVKEIRQAGDRGLPPSSDSARVEVDFEFDVVVPEP